MNTIYTIIDTSTGYALAADGQILRSFDSYDAAAGAMQDAMSEDDAGRAHWDDEGTWNSCFGPTETRATVLAEAESQGVTPQGYARSCVEDAIDQGATFDADEAFASLCRQLGVAIG